MLMIRYGSSMAAVTRKMSVPIYEHSQRSRKIRDLRHVAEPLADRPEAGADEKERERDDQRRTRWPSCRRCRCPT